MFGKRLTRTTESFGIFMGLLALVCVGIMGQGCPPAAPDTDNGGGTGDTGVTGKYAGASKCELCHSRHYDNWLETAHSGALNTLEAIGQGSNASCLGCHTVGYGETGGFVDRATTNTLAGVQCENCHGAAYEHTRDVTNDAKKPYGNIAASVCGKCHNDEHHPYYEEWLESGHGNPGDHPFDSFIEGSSLTSCGVCHSGDYRQKALVEGETVENDLLEGLTFAELNPVVCVTCHDPHERTGNAVSDDSEHDAQLRYAEVAYPTASNTVVDATDPDRFNICGQCHHSRGRTWDATSRGPHHSLQANVYVGEMPVPEGTSSLVESERSVHGFVEKQCVTCHRYTKSYTSEENPAITGHTFEVNTAGCTGKGCHPTEEIVIADLAVRQTKTQNALDSIASRLGEVSAWEYTSDGGPDAAGQTAISDDIKKVRFIYHYVNNDGSLGVHNPQYVDSLLDEADRILTSRGK